MTTPSTPSYRFDGKRASKFDPLTGTCRNGHPWATSVYVKKNGDIFCRVCCYKRKMERAMLAWKFPERMQPATVRVFLYLDKTPGHGPWGNCWPYTRTLTPAGYGQIGKDGRLAAAHRVAYEAAYGPFPSEIKVLHRCDFRPCCRPDHLFLGSQAQNMRDMMLKERGTCKLSWESVRQIRTRHSTGETRESLALRFGVSVSNIGMIVNHRTWKENL